MAKGNINLNITKNEHSFIDGGTGEELTPEQFNQKYSAINLGGLRDILSRGQTEEADTVTEKV